MKQNDIRAWREKYIQANKSQRVDVLKENVPSGKKKGFTVVWVDKIGLRRLYAAGIDAVMLLVPMFFLVIPLVSYSEAWWPIIFIGLCWIPFYALCRDGIGGAGVGKRIMGLRVVYKDTKEPIGVKQSMLRYPFFWKSYYYQGVLYVGLTGIGAGVRESTEVIRTR